MSRLQMTKALVLGVMTVFSAGSIGWGQAPASQIHPTPECREPLNFANVSMQNLLSKASDDPTAACLLGFAYHTGVGIVRNDGEAVRWFLIAANAGLPLAEDELGYLYEHGLGVSQDDRLA